MGNINKQIENGERLYWPGGNQFIPNFIEKDDKRYFYLRDKGEFIEIHDSINKLETFEINPNDYGFIKIGNDWFSNKTNILTSKNIESNLRNNFIEINGIKYYRIKDDNGYHYEKFEDILQKLDSGEYNSDNFPGFNKRYCKKCGCEVWHYRIECLVCGTVNKLASGGGRPNKIICNGVRFWKGEPAEELVRDLLSGKKSINNYKPLEIRFGNHVCYKGKDILTDEAYLLNNGNIAIVDNVEYVYDRRIGKYVEANYFYSEYVESIKNLGDIDSLVQKFIYEEGFNLEPIINNTNDPDMWNRDLTDNYLVSRDYG